MNLWKVSTSIMDLLLADIHRLTWVPSLGSTAPFSPSPLWQAEPSSSYSVKVSSASIYYAPSICLQPKPGNIKECSKRPENCFIFFFFFTFWLWGLCCYSRAFSSCSELGLPSGCGKSVSHCSGFSSRQAQALQQLWLAGSRMWVE